MTSSLPRKCSTTELQQPPAERVKGIEPSYSAWKAAALPLSYTRTRREKTSPGPTGSGPVDGRFRIDWVWLTRIRIFASGRPKWGLQDSNLCRRSQRIYSPPPLTTRANPQNPILSSFRFPSPGVRGLSPFGKIRSKSRSVECLVRDDSRASGGIRTHDRLITNQLLCQLSYAGGTPTDPTIRPLAVPCGR